MATSNAQARFEINGTPSEDPVSGDRLYTALNLETLTVTLEQNPSPALSATFQVFDSTDLNSPLASKNAPLITWNENGNASITLGPVPFGIDGDVTIDMPAVPVAPATGIMSYLIRCTVSTAGDGTPSSQEQVFERLVLIFSGATAPPIRKTIPGESTEARARGWSDSLNDMIDAVENALVVAAGSLQVSYNLGNVIDTDVLNGPLQFRGTIAQNTSPLQVQIDGDDVLVVSGLGAVDIDPMPGESFFVNATAGGGVAIVGDSAVGIDASTGDISLDTQGVARITVANAGNVGVGTTVPNQVLHVRSGGTSGYTAGANRGILVTDSLGPRVVFEDSGEGIDDKVMGFRYESENLTAFALNDLGNALTRDNILVLNRDGNVGIGTQLPDSLLHLQEGDTGLTPDANSNFVLESTIANRFMAFLGPNASTRGFLFGNATNSADGGILYDNTAREMLFRTAGNVTRMTIDNAGNVGIGVTAPNDRLHVLASGVSSYTDAQHGLLITDAVSPGIIFEDTGESIDKKVFELRSIDQKMVYRSLSDSGASVDTDNILAIDREGRAGINTPVLKDVLHVTTGVGVSSAYAGTKRGILITGGDGPPHIVFEDEQATATNRVMELRAGNEALTIASLTDDGTSTDVDNILVVNRDGRVGIGAAPSLSGQLVITPPQADQARSLVFDTERQWAFKQDGSGSNAQLTLQSLNSQKSFNVQSSTGEYIARFLAGASTSNVLLAEESLANVGIGVVGNPLGSAKLQVDSTDKGFLPPRLTTPERNAIVSPATGLEIFNTDTVQPEFYTGTVWAGTGTGTETLQGAYDNGQTIAMFAATGDLVLNATDAVAFKVQKGGAPIIEMTAGGEVDITPLLNEGIALVTQGTGTISMTTLGAGDITLTTAAAGGVINLNANDTIGLISGTGLVADGGTGTLDLQTASTSRLFIENGGLIGVGTTTPRDTLHVLASGTSGVTATDQGILLTSNLAQEVRLVFEVPDAPANQRVMSLEFDGSEVHFAALSDDGTVEVKDDIMVIDRTGNVSVNGAVNLNSRFSSHVDTAGTSATIGTAIEAINVNTGSNVVATTSFRIGGVRRAGIQGQRDGASATDGKLHLMAAGASDNVRIVTLLGATENVGIGTEAPGASAKLQVDSIDKGFLPPRMTTPERNTIPSPVPGLTLFNLTRAVTETYDGTVWQPALPDNLVYFTDASGLPAPSGGVITLDANTHYVAYNDDPLTSQKTITLSDRIAIPDAGGVRISSVGLATVILNYSGVGNFLTTSDDYTGFLTIDNIFISAPTGTLFNISGVQPVGSEFFPRVFFYAMGFFNTDTIGTIQNISFNFNVGAFFDCGQGLVVRNMREVLISDVRFTDWKDEVGAVMLTTYGTLTQPKIAGCVFESQANETVFDLQPNVQPDEQIIVAANVIRGAGTVFQAGTSGAITAVDDQSESGTTISTVDGTPFGESLFTTSLAHDLVVGQQVIHTGFADADYNGPFLVLEVLSSTQYRVHAPFTATGSGSLASNIIEITSAAHGRVVGDAVEITDSLDSNDYDGPSTVINVPDVNRFGVNRIFVATDTGANWNTGSLDQNSVNAKFSANTGVTDSSSRLAIIMNANAALTTTIDGTYGAVVLTGLLTNPATARFRTVDLAAGIYRYVGLDPGILSGVVAVNVVKTGATAEYRLAASINGVPPVFASSPYIAVEVKTTKVQTGGPSLVMLQPRDTVQFMNAGDGTADSLTLTDLSITLQET